MADASHELKTPLAVIRTQSDVILLRERSPAEYVEALQTVASYAGKMTRLINDLLSLARIDSGVISAEAGTPVSLRECMNEALGTPERLALERGVRLCSFVDPTIFVMADKANLIELFQNLLENGVRYNRPGGEVTVRGSKEDRRAVVTISDTGMGIAAAEQERIFERFYRAPAARGIEGTGLGLSIVKAMIDAHGGSITVQSDPDAGSCFTITLPLVHTPQ